MKKYCTFFLLILFTTLTFSQSNDFNISVTVKGMENQIGILAFYLGEKRYVKDTLQFDAKGVATLKGKKDIAAGVYLVAFPSMRFNSFDIIINETSFSIATDTTDFIKNAVVKNSTENKQMFDDMKYMMPLGIKNDSLQKKLKTLAKTDSSYKIIAAEIDGISKKITAHRKEMVKKHPTTFYTKLLKMMLEIDVPEGERNKDGSLVDTFHNFHYTQQHYFDNIDFSDSGLSEVLFFSRKY
jgi:hypothetical protein